jgi:hypothetical protein
MPAQLNKHWMLYFRFSPILNADAGRVCGFENINSNTNACGVAFFTPRGSHFFDYAAVVAAVLPQTKCHGGDHHRQHDWALRQLNARRDPDRQLSNEWRRFPVFGLILTVAIVAILVFGSNIIGRYMLRRGLISYRKRLLENPNAKASPLGWVVLALVIFFCSSLLSDIFSGDGPDLLESASQTSRIDVLIGVKYHDKQL